MGFFMLCLILSVLWGFNGDAPLWAKFLAWNFAALFVVEFISNLNL
jgi:hypothetical protein